MAGEAKRDYPASINYQSPWWREYSYVENHFARVNTAMTRGKPIVKVAVVHPIESYWLHWGPSEQTALERDQLDQNGSRIVGEKAEDLPLQKAAYRSHIQLGGALCGAGHKIAGYQKEELHAEGAALKQVEMEEAVQVDADHGKGEHKAEKLDLTVFGKL